jgi:hypothetical protein
LFIGATQSFEFHDCFFRAGGHRMDWLGRDKTWPEHPRKEARQALDDAKAAGWMFAEFSDHAFGKIRCTVHHEPSCEVTILSTGKGDKSGAVTANIIRQKLRSCRNREPESGPPSAADAHRALVSAERLAEAAVRLRLSEGLRSRSDDQLARAERAGDADTADRLLEQAAAADERAEIERYAAWVDANRFGLGEPWPPDEGARELERAAREQLNLAMSGVSVVDDPDDFGERIEAVLEQLAPFC